MTTDEPHAVVTQQKQTSVPIPWCHDAAKMMFNLRNDLIDTWLEKRIQDPLGKQTWVYKATYGKYAAQFAQGPKSIRIVSEI